MQPVVDARRPGRPRSVQADRAILDATVQLFAEQGYGGLTVDGVAALAGVSKATIYRRYDSKLELVVAAMSCFAAQKREALDTGTVEGDLRGVLDSLVEFLTRTEAGSALPTLVSEALRYPELADAHREFVTERRAATRAAIERGIARGELRPDTDPDLLSDMLVGPVFYRVLISGMPVDGALAKQVVGALMEAFGCPSARGRGRPTRP